MDRNQRWRARQVAERPEEFRREQTERMKRWRQENPEKARAAGRRSNNSEAGKAANKRYAEKNPEKRLRTQRSSSLKHRYNLTEKQWDEMFAAQGSACANPACRSTEPNGKWWHTDHCHETGRFRAILCKPCNMALGMAKDSPAILRGLAEHIERHSQTMEGPAC